MNVQNNGGNKSVGVVFIMIFVATIGIAGFLSLYPTSAPYTLFIAIGTIIANFLAFMQVYPQIKSHINAVRLTYVTSVFLCLFVLSLALNILMLTRVIPASFQTKGNTNTPTASPSKVVMSPALSPAPSSITASPTSQAVARVSPTTQPDLFASSLIPIGQSPTIDDPLGNNSKGYEWDTGENSQGTGSCDFEGSYYLLTAPAGQSNGIGCGPNTPKGNFSNFVYQIKMTILTGIEPNGEAGPIFRVNPNGDGQQYQVSFDVEGDWSFTSDKGNISGGLCATPCSYFNKGANQPNIITIRAVGSSMQVQINGHDLGSFTDSSYTSGYIGVEMSPDSSKGAVAFSDLRVWQL